MYVEKATEMTFVRKMRAYNVDEIDGWSSDERRGITVWAIIVLRFRFKNRLHLKTRWKDGLLDGRKYKGSKPRQKNIFENIPAEPTSWIIRI